MTVENRELYEDLKGKYPILFCDDIGSIHLMNMRGCGKSITRCVVLMQYYYTQIFINKLQHSETSFTLEKYENDLREIEKLVWDNFYN